MTDKDRHKHLHKHTYSTESHNTHTHTLTASLTTLGLNGGWISLLARRSQSMRLKKACSLMSLSPSGPQPRRFDGCLVISW